MSVVSPVAAGDSLENEFRALRCTEFARLDGSGHVYLDYTGAALYAARQIDTHHRRLLGAVLGNPHSENPTAIDSTERMERARREVLAFLHADPAEYEVVFTANASAALRIVGESFPFAVGSRFVLTADNHNSVNGIRSYAMRAGAQLCYLPLDDDLRVADLLLPSAESRHPNLFAFPAQSNFSGVRHPLTWVAEAQSQGYRVLLDAAAYVPTAELRLDQVRPDFVPISFYKMFGYPTGVGALVVRRDAMALLRRPWFAGGTIIWASTQDLAHALRPGAGGYEDGTPDFLAFDAIGDGLDLLRGIGMARICARMKSLMAVLMERLLELHHPDGRPLLAMHGPHSIEERGAVVAFNVLDAGGVAVPFEEVVARAGRAGVSLRGGCFCNPGCAEAALAFSAERARACRVKLTEGDGPAGFAACMDGPVGAVRASLGIPTIREDIDRLIDVLATWRGHTPPRPRPPIAA